MSAPLTIGMATFDDFDGVYFAVQSLRVHHDVSGCELVVVDTFGCGRTRDFVGKVGGRYVLDRHPGGTAAPRDRVFRLARRRHVMVLDCHVLFLPGAVRRVRKFFSDDPACRDLVQGPLVYDGLSALATHFAPVWRDMMYGHWARDRRGRDPDGPAFEIPMQGLGVFACARDAWPGFHPDFRGFGGEEGYIHEKFRRRGGRCLCLPGLRWLHRFGPRPGRAQYANTYEGRLRNYLLGWSELGKDVGPVFRAFGAKMSADRMQPVADGVFGRGAVRVADFLAAGGRKAGGR